MSGSEFAFQESVTLFVAPVAAKQGNETMNKKSQTGVLG
jgi:hypothetical protein